MKKQDRGSSLLKIPYGTAMGRLRKMILFNLLKKHKENVCVRCKKPIHKLTELSIEHIKPWEHISADLFWSLNNIAFSHLKCNVPHQQIRQRKQGRQGTAWCSRHQKFLSIKKFHKFKDHWNGFQGYCKECRRKQRLKYFA